MVPPDFGVLVGLVAPSVPTTLTAVSVAPGTLLDEPSVAPPPAPVADDPPQAESPTTSRPAIATAAKTAMCARRARREARGWSTRFGARALSGEERFLSFLFMWGSILK